MAAPQSYDSYATLIRRLMRERGRETERGGEKKKIGREGEGRKINPCYLI
jgi:hypothetical protein